MNANGEELPVTPEGHVLLLLEESPGRKTFSDYQDINECLSTMVAMYEEYRDAVNETDSGDLKDFLNWLDSLHHIDCFQYSREVNRYKRIPRNDLGLLFGEHKGAKPTTNGIDNGGGTSELDKRPNSLNDDYNGAEEEEEDQLDYDDDDDDAWDR